MDGSAWSFVFNYNSEHAIPSPWERCLDLQAHLVYYRNVRDDVLIFDLRSRVNLGDGIYLSNNYWNELLQRDSLHDYPLSDIRSENNYDDHNLIIIPASCCGPRLYLLITQFVLRCPLCNHNVNLCVIRRIFRF